jgi:hypothetical protein
MAVCQFDFIVIHLRGRVGIDRRATMNGGEFEARREKLSNGGRGL